ncbi:hypothetical protein [Burkholderia cenocepacia]|nr:hypothetical protein [Burkholderia cenocepacia]MDR5640432.1 hypothetical protein [Burkholderia cenocepacia]
MKLDLPELFAPESTVRPLTSIDIGEDIDLYPFTVIFTNFTLD